MKKIYVDANVFVDAVIPERPYHEQSKDFFESIFAREDIKVCTSVWTQLEIVSAIRRHFGRRKVWRWLYDFHREYFLEGRVKWLYPTKKGIYNFEKLVNIFIDASIIHGTPSGDTIHIHTMITNRIKTLITRDKDHFKESKGRREVLTPEEFLKKLGK